MSFLGNIIWFLTGGFLTGLFWALAGLLWCVTIIGIPVGVQCFKFAVLSLCPFGKDVVYSSSPVSLIVNIIWIIVSGVPLAIVHAAFGLVLCITVVGIPFGLQHFKLAKLALMPFGSSVV